MIISIWIKSVQPLKLGKYSQLSSERRLVPVIARVRNSGCLQGERGLY